MDKNITELLDFFHIMEYLINSNTHHFLKMAEKNTDLPPIVENAGMCLWTHLPQPHKQ